MSRVGKNPVIVPEKTQVSINGTTVTVKGPKGELEYTFNNLVTLSHEGNEVKVNPIDESKKSRAMWGTARQIISNMVTGVTDGFTRKLEFNGVGYKASVSGNTMTLNLGYSHPIEYVLPETVAAKVTKNEIELTGPNKELLGFAAAKIRSFRPPEPYKGKGVKYAEEHIVRKAGKSGGK